MNMNIPFNLYQKVYVVQKVQERWTVYKRVQIINDFKVVQQKYEAEKDAFKEISVSCLVGKKWIDKDSVFEYSTAGKTAAEKLASAKNFEEDLIKTDTNTKSKYQAEISFTANDGHTGISYLKNANLLYGYLVSKYLKKTTVYKISKIEFFKDLMYCLTTSKNIYFSKNTKTTAKFKRDASYLLMCLFFDNDSIFTSEVRGYTYMLDAINSIDPMTATMDSSMVVLEIKKNI